MNKSKLTYVAPKIEANTIELEQGIAAGSCPGNGHGNGNAWGHCKDDEDFPGNNGNGHGNGNGKGW